MADVESRRESRRRKILENSEKRLKKISGVDGRTTKNDLELSSCSEIESRSYVVNNLTDKSFVNHSNAQTTLNSSQVETIFENPRHLESDSVSSYNVVERNEYIVNRNLFLLILPTALSFVLIISAIFKVDISSIYLNKVFIPFILFEIFDYFFGSINNSTNFLTSLLLLLNIRNRFLAIYLEYVQYILRIMQDMMIYFFVFTLTYNLLKVTLL